jgi:hypothetical protein
MGAPDHRHRPLAFALYVLGFALVFRGWLFTGFDGAFGDEWTTRNHIEGDVCGLEPRMGRRVPGLPG